MWAQSLYPDQSEIWMTFKTATQFPDEGMNVFQVYFKDGKALTIKNVTFESSNHENRKEASMPRKLIVLFIAVVLCFLSGCATAGLPKAPIGLPFAVHHGGIEISTELQIVRERAYYFSIRFYYYGDSSSADAKRVRKLVGGGARNKADQYTEPGVAVPSVLKIEGTTESGQKVSIEKEFVITGHDAHGFTGFNGAIGGYFTRGIGFIRLAPGIYRITVRTLKDIPELAGTPVEFRIGWINL